MAFIKSYTLHNGISGEFWQISSITVNPFEPSISCAMSLFKDSETAGCHSMFDSKIITSYLVVITGQQAMDFISDVSPDPVTGEIDKDASTAMYEVLAGLSDKPWFNGLPAIDVFHWMQV